MQRLALSVTVFACCVLAVWAADTQNAAATRNKKLQVKVTVNFEDTTLKECFEVLQGEVESAGAGNLSFKYDAGVSMNLKITYSAKEQKLADVLDGMFKKNGLGYIVLSKEKDRYDGWILIKQGRERGYAEGEEPAKATAKEQAKDKPAAKEKDKPMPKEKPPAKPLDDEAKLEQRASSKLSMARDLLKDGKASKAKQYCEDILKSYPKTKAAEQARDLLKQLEK